MSNKQYGSLIFSSDVTSSGNQASWHRTTVAFAIKANSKTWGIKPVCLATNIPHVRLLFLVLSGHTYMFVFFLPQSLFLVSCFLVYVLETIYLLDLNDRMIIIKKDWCYFNVLKYFYISLCLKDVQLVSSELNFMYICMQICVWNMHRLAKKHVEQNT